MTLRAHCCLREPTRERRETACLPNAMSSRSLTAFLLFCCIIIGSLSTASSFRPSRHKDDSDRGSKHRLRAHSHRAAHHRAALAAALVGTAQSHQTGVNPHRKRAIISSAPPEKCGHGSISFIKCWLDPQGFVSGLSFESKLGTKAQSLCSTEGKHQEEAFLYDGETILDIVACRVPGGGVSRLEFYTDSSRVDPLICGHGGRNAKLEAEGGTDEPAEAAGAEWCESLTQGRAPHGSFEISANGPRQSDAVQYDLKELYPVGGLTARCSKEGGPILEISNTCWEAEDSTPSVQGPVVVEAWVTLNDGPDGQVKDPVHQEECVPDLCSDEVTTKQLSTWAATALPHILEDVGTRDVWVKHSVLACKPCSEEAGTLLQVALALYTQQGSLPAVEQTLRSLMARTEKNLCGSKDIAIGCKQTGVGTLKLANVWVKNPAKRPKPQNFR